MKILITDVEHTVTIIDHKKNKLDLSPFNSNNKLVSVGWAWIEDGKVGPIDYAFFYHKELPADTDVKANVERFQKALDEADVLVAHNSKHDCEWLLECGFKLPENTKCTMVREYVLARGLNTDLSLKGCAITNQLTLKKTELIQDYMDKGIMFDEIPIDIVEEYGIGDIQTCGELYLAQEIRYNQTGNTGLIKTRDMMCEFTSVLIEMERNGIKIDLTELDRVEAEFTKERSTLEIRVAELLAEVMGDTPINIGSPEQLSQVIYSRKVINKKKWAETFNLGLNDQGKPLRRPRMPNGEFKNNVVKLCNTVYKTTVDQCSGCNGLGYFYKIKKSGEQFKKSTKCPQCYEGTGVVYKATNEIAGFKMQPTGVYDVSAGGFATDKETLTALINKAKDTKNAKAIEFLTAVIRISALDTYLSSFVNGIRRGTQKDGLLHTKFNQTITSTGRLSSTDPNLQNQPRGSTFPIRGVFISRWAKEGGALCETDMSQLEFRCAGHLAKDKQILDDIKNGKDIHGQTSKILTEAGQETNRQDAKPHTFKPLYGGLSGTQAEVVYYKSFLDLYSGVKAWHVELQEEALEYKKIVLPTGREYAFPYVTRNYWGNASNKTQIVNWPVQGYATGDIVPVALIYLWKEYKKHNLKSLLCLTVHDSVDTDMYPGEEEIVKTINKKLHKFAEDALESYYGITMYVPLDSETKIGPNLLNMKKV